MTSSSHLKVILLLVVVKVLVPSTVGEALECSSCGQDCMTVCGSRQFRNCCFNYIKKRSVLPILPNEEIDAPRHPHYALSIPTKDIGTIGDDQDSNHKESVIEDSPSEAGVLSQSKASPEVIWVALYSSATNSRRAAPISLYKV